MDAGSKALAHTEIMNVLSLYYQALDQGDLDTLESRVLGDYTKFSPPPESESMSASETSSNSTP